MIEGVMDARIRKHVAICTDTGSWLANDTLPAFLETLDICGPVDVPWKHKRFFSLLNYLN
jgi:hypothetical protein